MLDAKEKGILLSIVKKCERIDAILCNKTKEEFDLNDDLIELVCFNLFQIGEIASKLDNSFIEKYNKVPWKQIIGMRHRIVHGYDSVDVDIVYETAKTNIFDLKNYCLEIIDINK